MSNYTKATDFAAKDSLPSGDAAKVIKGAEFEDEFDAIATAVNSKADTASPTFTGIVTIPTAAVTTFSLGGTTVTSTAAELNLLDGVTATTTEINYVDGVTSNIQTQLDAKAPTASPTFTGTATIPTASVTTLNLGGIALTSTAVELNYVNGVTSNIQTQLNSKGTVDNLGDLGLTATAVEINKLDGVTASTTELNYVTGVTSSIQTQLDAKGTVSSLSDLSVTATAAELNYVDGVTSNVQTQLNAKVNDSDFTQSLASNGWTELPNGLIIQWGRQYLAANASNSSVSFPKAFTTACFQVVITGEDNTTSRGDNFSLGETAPTTSTFRITNGVNEGLYFRFIAIGH